MKSLLERIKVNHEFRKGEGWEFTTLTEDIDWLIEQAERTVELQMEVEMLMKEKHYLLDELGKSDTKLINIKRIINEI